ncbi:ABC-2 type transport system permease protein [Actinacidiphila alni]|uniref:ABC-2 type transport system permease protein n=1 Tax=Actinacidiphila alni TaxID=380248 RepID=A0A1I2HZ64_9ACTN|nr:ABC transporter permease subunit [Actinacidiphila alni]SFF34693.1 ABC-2 type transport system permease protein [Actinacidiphila alni]
MTAPAQFPAPAPFGGGPQQPQYTSQFAPSFGSQLPVEPTTLGQAVRSEWTKIRTVRSTVWTLSVMLVLVIGINLLVIVPINDDNDPTVPVLAPGLFGLLLGQLAVITLGVLVITSEYGTGMIRTTLTACPKRSRVLTAKAIVFFLLSFVTTTVACTMTALISWSVLSGKTPGGYDLHGDHPGVVIKDGVTSASGTEWLGATIGVGLYVALLGLLALAVGTLLRHSAGAVSAMLGVVLLPLLVAIFLPSGLDTAREKLVKYSAPNSLASLYHFPMIGDGDQNGVPQLIALAVVTAVLLGAAYAALTTRDV